MKIVLENWGPIRKFEYDFSKSLIVTYGDNNIGKSYAMQTVYLFLKYLILYARNNMVHSSLRNVRFHGTDGEEKTPEGQMLIAFVNKKGTEIEDISEKLNQICAMQLSQTLFPSLQEVFENNFGTYPSILKGNPKIIIKIADKISCWIDFYHKKIEFTSLRKATRLRKVQSEFHKSRNGKEYFDIYVYENHLSTPLELLEEEIWRIQREFFVEILKRVQNVYFLPASRSGIHTGMSSFGPIIAQLSQKRAYIREPIQIPNISEPVSDYYIMLSEINGNSEGDFSSYAEEIEEQILKGKVTFDKKSKALIYHPVDTALHLEMKDTSSMVAEIAPITAYLKYIAGKELLPYYIRREIDLMNPPKVMIFIEEPEAHLHPVNQIALVKIFAKLAQENMILVMASHSNYIFNQLNNLILEKKLDAESYSPILLQQKGNHSVSTYMEMDELGVEDENFADVSFQLLEEREFLLEKLMEEHTTG